MIDQGMTHAEIAAEVSRQTGYPVGRSTISAALHRAGKASPAKKYPREIPWDTTGQHNMHYAARMLRLLGRRNAGVRNSVEADAKLDAWLAKLEDAKAVVVYVPDTEEGFFYVQEKPDVPGIPVKKDFVV